MAHCSQKFVLLVILLLVFIDPPLVGGPNLNYVAHILTHGGENGSMNIGDGSLVIGYSAATDGASSPVHLLVPEEDVPLETTRNITNNGSTTSVGVCAGGLDHQDLEWRAAGSGCMAQSWALLAFNSSRRRK